MNIIYDDETLEAYRNEADDHEMLAHVERLVKQAKAQCLWEHTCISVVAPDETLGELTALLGDDPLAIPWTWRTNHGAILELGVTVGNDGFAHIVLGRVAAPS